MQMRQEMQIKIVILPLSVSLQIFISSSDRDFIFKVALVDEIFDVEWFIELLDF